MGLDPSYSLKFSPSTINSLDARALQYKYALTKLSLFIKAIDRIIEEATTAGHNKCKIYLVHYISFCVANLFAINESSFAPKLATIANFKIPKASTVQISAVVTHVPYDGKDYTVNPLSDLPPVGKSILCLKALKSICINCLDGYKKRYINASREIGNENYFNDLEYLFEFEFFGLRRDLDLSLLSTHLLLEPLEITIDLSHTEDGNYAEASLIDMDISSLFIFIYTFSESLEQLSGPIHEMRAIKLAPKGTQQNLFLKLPNKSYSLHMLLFWAFRLNDLYLTLRKALRQILHSNLEHLKDRKFLSYVPNTSIFQRLLAEVDEICNTAKKNGVIVATITRFIRSNSKYDVNGQSCLEFIGFIHQFLISMESLLLKLKSFGQYWIAGEMSFRTDYNLSIHNLGLIQMAVTKKPATRLELRRDYEKKKREKEKEQEKEEAQIAKRRIPMRSKPRITKCPSPTKSDLSNDTLILNGSLPSFDSSTDLFSEELSALLPNVLFKGESLNQVKVTSEPMIHKTASTSSLPLTIPTSEIEPMTKGKAGRARSSSLPLSFNASHLAFKNSVNVIDGKVENRQTVANNVRIQRQTLPVVPDLEKSDAVKLSASQKLQQHLQEASKAGTLLGKEKMVLTSVVFDPNNPSATNLKRSSKLFSKFAAQASESSNNDIKDGNQSSHESRSIVNDRVKTTPLLSSSAAATASKSRSQMSVDPKAVPSRAQERKAEKEDEGIDPEHCLTEERNVASTAVVSTKPTRAQITKRNTQRNSVLVQLDCLDVSTPSNESAVSNFASSSVSASNLSPETVKKVRFTGVKEWTPAEDAPTKNSNRILKNFASLTLTSFGRSAFKQKDQMLKKEESFSFKNHLNPSESAAHHTLAASYTLRFSSFRHNKK